MNLLLDFCSLNYYNLGMDCVKVGRFVLPHGVSGYVVAVRPREWTVSERGNMDNKIAYEVCGVGRYAPARCEWKTSADI